MSAQFLILLARQLGASRVEIVGQRIIARVEVPTMLMEAPIFQAIPGAVAFLEALRAGRLHGLSASASTEIRASRAPSQTRMETGGPGVSATLLDPGNPVEEVRSIPKEEFKGAALNALGRSPDEGFHDGDLLWITTGYQGIRLLTKKIAGSLLISREIPGDRTTHLCIRIPLYYYRGHFVVLEKKAGGPYLPLILEALFSTNWDLKRDGKGFKRSTNIRTDSSRQLIDKGMATILAMENITNIADEKSRAAYRAIAKID